MSTNKLNSWQDINIPKDVIAIAKKYNLVLPIHATDRTADFWKCHARWLITHNACMRVAEHDKIKFEFPEKYYAETDSVSILVKAIMYDDDGMPIKDVWTFGEASSQNCKLSYWWSMAEKRGKDRAVLQLTGLYNTIKSEEEADWEDIDKDKEPITKDFKPFKKGDFADTTLEKMPDKNMTWIIETSTMGDDVKAMAKTIMADRKKNKQVIGTNGIIINHNMQTDNPAEDYH